MFSSTFTRHRTCRARGPRVPIISGGGGGGGGSGGLTKITSTTLAAPAASIALSSIPGTYSALMLVWALRSAVVAETGSGTSIRFNADTGANYNYQHNWGASSTPSSGGTAGATSLQVFVETGPSATANMFGTGHTIIPFYADTTRLKTAISTFALHPTIGSTTSYIAGDITGVWNSTSAINAITVFASDLTSNLATGCQVVLYGLT